MANIPQKQNKIVREDLRIHNLFFLLFYVIEYRKVLRNITDNTQGPLTN